MEKLKGTLSKKETLNAELQSNNKLSGKMASTRYAKDYNKLINHPTLNGIEIIGDKTSQDYNLQEELDLVSEQDIDNIIYG